MGKIYYKGKDYTGFEGSMNFGEPKNNTPYRFRNVDVQQNKVSNFSGSSCGVIPLSSLGNILHPSWDSPFEVGIRCKFSSTSGQQEVFGNESGGYYKTPAIEIQGNVLTGFISTSGNSWDYYIAVSLETLNYIDTWLSVKFIYDGTNVTISCSDGETSVEYSEAVSSVYSSSSYNIIFGSINNNGNLYARYMTLDLDHTYIKDYQGNVIWGNV